MASFQNLFSKFSLDFRWIVLPLVGFSIANSLCGQSNGCFPDQFEVLVSDSGSSGTKSANGGQQQLTFTTSYNFQVFASNPVRQGNLVTYEIKNVVGTWNFSGEAKQEISPGFWKTDTWNTTVTYNSWTPTSSTLVFDLSKNTVIRIEFSKSQPIFPSNPTLYGLSYHSSLPFTILQIDLPSGWGFSNSYSLKKAECTFSPIDTQPPVAKCWSGDEMVLTLGQYLGNCGYYLGLDEVDAGSTDNCGIKSRALSQTEFFLNDLGKHTVVLTVTDVAGLTSSCTVNVLVEKPTVEFFTENRFLPMPNKLAETPADACSLPVVKVCADGSSETSRIVVSNVKYPDRFAVRIREDLNSDHIKTYGSFQSAQGQQPDKAAFWYLHPDGFYDNNEQPVIEPFKIFQLEVYQISDDRTIVEIPVQLFRSPVFLIHGLGDAGKSMQPLADFLQKGGPVGEPMWPEDLIDIIDYEATNDVCFLANRDVVLTHLRNKIIFLSKEYSVSRGNVVAHSMGGLLTRLFLQDQSSLPYENDLVRFITLDTPHSGSQLADLVQILGSSPILKSPLTWAGQNPFACAIQNLKVESEAFWSPAGLNHPSNLNKNTAPTHAVFSHVESVTSVASLPNCSGNFFPLIEILFNVLKAENFLTFAVTFGDFMTNQIYNGEKHDVIVPVSSQIGGLSANSEFPEVWHNCAIKAPETMNWVRILLNNDPHSSLFSDKGFQPPKLFFDLNPFTVQSPYNGSVKITSPASGTVFRPGDPLQVSVAGTGSVSQNFFIIGGNGQDTHAESKDGSSNQFDWQIPLTVAGVLKIGTIGLDTAGVVAFDTISILVKPTAQPLELRLDLQSILMAQYSLMPIEVNVLYADGVLRPVSQHPETQFEVLNPDLAKMSGQAVLEGVKPGTTKIIAWFMGLSDTAEVTILPGQPLVSTQPEPEQPSRLGSIKLENFPNPISMTSGTTFGLTTVEPSAVFLEIFDLTGRTVFSQQMQKLPKGKNSIFWDGKATNGSILPNGIYFARARAKTATGFVSNCLKLGLVN